MQKAPKEMRLLVNMLMLDVLMMMKVKVLLVKVFVLEEVLLFSLSPTPTQTTNPRTRPAARVWARDAKGSGFEFAAPAPGRRCSGPETRPLAELGTASARGGERGHLVLFRSRLPISLHEISPAA